MVAGRPRRRLRLPDRNRIFRVAAGACGPHSANRPVPGYAGPRSDTACPHHCGRDCGRACRHPGADHERLPRSARDMGLCSRHFGQLPDTGRVGAPVDVAGVESKTGKIRHRPSGNLQLAPPRHTNPFGRHVTGPRPQPVRHAGADRHQHLQGTARQPARPRTGVLLP